MKLKVLLLGLSYIAFFGFVVCNVVFIGNLYAPNNKKIRSIILNPSDVASTYKRNLTYEESISNPTQFQEKDQCHPHLGFVYLKTHKTGSSTVRNVLNDFARKHSKNIAFKIPMGHSGAGGYPGYIKKEFIFVNDGGKIRPINLKDDFVITDHFRFNYSVLADIMPNGTKYISIVRQPWANFQSAFYYNYSPFQYMDVYRTNCFNYPFLHLTGGKINSFEDYLQTDFDSIDNSIPFYFRSKNYQSFDLGLDPFLDDDDEINKVLKILDSQIDLMMITDYMDESMILLKELLCMSWPEVTYESRMRGEYGSPIRPRQDSEIMKRFSKLYNLDIALFGYFNQTFWKKVDSYGRERMARDVKKLRRLRKNIQQPVKKMNYKVINKKESFQETKKNYTHQAMTMILKQKILAEHRNIINENVTTSIAQYIVQNGGGCPVVPPPADPAVFAGYPSKNHQN